MWWKLKSKKLNLIQSQDFHPCQELEIGKSEETPTCENKRDIVHELAQRMQQKVLSHSKEIKLFKHKVFGNPFWDNR